MKPSHMEAVIKNIDARTTRIEQILPTLATKEDLTLFATKEDLTAFATKEDLKPFATKADLKAYPTRDEMTVAILEEGTRTRAHFDVVAESLREGIQVIAEGHKSLGAKIDTLAAESRKELAAHDRRIMKLEAESAKRR
jgi:uncharacterized NAD-dependent epimerase/dehydratase family protein